MAVSRRRALIVTTGRARGVLTAVRALHRAGWFVGLGTPDAGGMVAASRWCRLRHLMPRPRGDAEAFVAAVRDAVADGGYDVIFGGGDDWVAALAAYRREIPARVAHPDEDTVAVALDKIELTRRASDVGLRVPKTEVANAATLAQWCGPVVVKCRAHWHPGQQHQYRIEAQRYPDTTSATEQIQFIRQEGFEPIVQEPVDGQLGALIGLFHEGRLLGRVQQRASHLWPTPAGVSSRAQTVPIDERLAARATALLAHLQWSGLVELQFLIPPGGEPYLIDLNGRFYGSMALAIAAGPNLPDAWARQALGLPLPQLEDGRPGVRYLWAAGDLRRAARERRGGLFGDIASTLRWAPGATASVWDLHDMGPTLHLITSRLRRTVGERDVRSLAYQTLFSAFE